jgi:hypothetical protein
MSISGRLAVRGVIVGVAVIVGGIIHFTNKNSSSGEYRKRSHQLVSSVEGYSASPDYYDWLVDEAHDAVFDGAYHTERRGRYSEKTWVDRNQYLDEMFSYMIEQAKTDKATSVAESLQKYASTHTHASR